MKLANWVGVSLNNRGGTFLKIMAISFRSFCLVDSGWLISKEHLSNLVSRF